MSTRRCSFCHKMTSLGAFARICSRCAQGRIDDARCDFCKSPRPSEMAWICPSCAKGRVGDQWCDFCRKTTTTAMARICSHCNKA